MNTYGLSSDKTKKTTTSKHNTWCSLCSKRISKGETCYTWAGKQFLVHTDCNSPESRERVHNVEFRENVILKPKKRGKRGKESLIAPSSR